MNKRKLLILGGAVLTAAAVAVSATVFLSGSESASSGSLIFIDSAGSTSSNVSVDSTLSSNAVSSEVGSSSSTVSTATSSAAAPPAPTVDPTHKYYDVISRVTGLDNTRYGYSFSYGEHYAKGYPISSYENDAAYRKYGMHSIESTEEKIIYLTFDEGYEYQNNTKYILDKLKSKGVTATFFVTKSYALERPDLVERMLAEGHVVGNHSCNHPDMTTISPERFVDEVMGVHELMLERHGYEMHLFRPPTGAFSIRTLTEARLLGYRTVEWSFAYGDYDEDNQPEREAALELTKRFTGPGRIYLLHAMSTTNVSILEELIDYWHSEGYTVTAYPNLPPEA